MKKTYISPVATIDCGYTDVILAGSGSGSGVRGYVNNDLEIENGGTDDDGSLTPASNYSFWDEKYCSIDF